MSKILSSQRPIDALVVDALNHLYDYPYLQTHPLGALLALTPTDGPRGRALQRRLLEAIDLLKPNADHASAAHAWRTYQYLFLRYVQALPLRDVTDQLGISARQSRRTFREAIDALTALLRELWLGEPVATDDTRTPGADSFPAAIPATAPAEQRGHPLADEASGLDQEQPIFPAEDEGPGIDPGEVIDGLRSILDELARQHGCSLAVRIAPHSGRVAVDRSILRQLLIIGCALLCQLGPGQLDLDLAPAGPAMPSREPTRPRGDLTAANGNATGTGAPDDRGTRRLTMTFHAEGSDDEIAPRLAAAEVQGRLALSRRLVAAAGGQLDFVPFRHGRCILRIDLPVGRRPLVLIIEDNPELLALYRRYLTTAGFAVAVAATGAAGVQMARTCQPAAIVLDVIMAGQDGWETLQQLKNHAATQAIPVLVCSVVREAELARFLGAADLLPKPVSRSELLAGLARCGLTASAGAHRSSPSRS